MITNDQLTELTAFAKRRVRDTYFGPERRSESRSALVCPVIVQPVDENLTPLDKGTWGVTRDISTAGVDFCHTDELGCELLALKLELPFGDWDDANLLARLVWTRPDGPFYSSGCKVLEMLQSFPFPCPELLADDTIGDSAWCDGGWLQSPLR